VNVEIPQEHIMQRFETQIESLREYQESLHSSLTGQSSQNLTFQQLELFFTNMDRQLNSLKDHLLINNRVKGAAFAVDDHHLVTISTIIQSATLGGLITIENQMMKGIPARLLNYDPTNGVAVLRVDDATFEHTVNLDNYREVPLPEASFIVGIQSIYTLPPAPVRGMIGGYYRRLGLFELERYIQTDLPLYPGNEGSPVFSPSGQLVGMVATEYHLGQAPGISFVIPADYIVNSAQEIIKTGSKERGVIPGVEFSLQETGVYILNIDENSPYKQLLQEGDVILEVDGEDPNSLMEIYEILHNTKPGVHMQLKVKRGDAQIDFAVETQKVQ
jgi:S1-C subfamily serine protease